MMAIPSTPVLRVLVVDDDEPMQILMDALFRRRDVIVDSVADGAAALERLGRERYDAIVLDLMLPRTNGFEVIRALKELDRELLSRTIVLTAASEAMLRGFAEGDGRMVRRVMRKPFDVSEFIAEVLSCSGAAAHQAEMVLPDQGGH